MKFFDIHEKTLEQIFKYVIIGLLTLFVDVILLIVLVEYVGTQPLIAATISYVSALAVHFNLNRYWNFKNFERIYYDQLRTYLLASFLFYIVNISIIEFFVALGFHYFIGKLVAIAILVCLSFIFNKYVTFNVGLRGFLKNLFKKNDESRFLYMIRALALLFKKHYLVIIFSLLVGSISVAPQVLSIQDLGKEYRGVPFFYIDDEDFYLMRMREITEGHYTVSSPAFFEYKDSMTPMLPLGELLYVIPSVMFGVSIISIVLFSKFILPALLFFLVYYLIFRITSGPESILRNLNAIAGGLMVVLGFDLVDYGRAIPILSGQADFTHLLIWTRLVNPITGAILLFALLNLLWAMFERSRKFLWIGAGLILGFMIYYFFSWGIAISVISVFGVITLIQKQHKLLAQLLAAVTLSIVVQLPYWIATIRSLSSSEGANTAMRVGMFFSHDPLFNRFLFVATAIFLPFIFYEWFKKRQLDRWWFFTLALLLGGWIAFNQQVMTGRMIWAFHFVQYTIPLIMVVFFIFLWNYVRPKIKFLMSGFVLTSIIVTLIFGVQSALSYQYNLDDFRDRQHYASFFSYLNNTAAPECVVLVQENTDNLTRLIPAFTNCNVYVSTYTFFGVPRERVFHNYLVLLRLRGIEPESLVSYLQKRVGEVNTFFFEDLNQSFSTELDDRAERLILNISEAYQAFIEEDFAQELDKYRLDYIVAENELDPDFIEDLRLKKIGKYGRVYVYDYIQS